MAARPRRDARPYHRSGEHIVAKAVPYLVQRVADPNIPDASLTPLERTVRGWRLEILQDLGGDAVSAAKRAVLDAAVGSRIILSTLDSFLFELAGQRPRDGQPPGPVRLPDRQRPHAGIRLPRQATGGPGPRPCRASARRPRHLPVPAPVLGLYGGLWEPARTRGSRL